MLKVASFDIVFQEIPGEVTLALNLANCPCHCPGCHSQHLAEDIGEELNESLMDGLIGRYGSMITCVAFMGGDAEPEEVARWAN
jgi:anaerobic ribonucleoside-triphosphate reductase activating protein